MSRRELKETDPQKYVQRQAERRVAKLKALARRLIVVQGVCTAAERLATWKSITEGYCQGCGHPDTKEFHEIEVLPSGTITWKQCKI